MKALRKANLLAALQRSTHRILGLRLLLLLLLGIGLPGIAAEQNAASRSLVIHGSATVGEHLAVEWIKQWLAQGQWQVSMQSSAQSRIQVFTAKRASETLRVDLQAFGTSTGFESLASGKADIAMASRQIQAKELLRSPVMQDLREPGLEHVVALDGLAVIVHPDRRLPALTIAQIRQIFAGTINNWSAFGQTPAPIKLALRDDKSGTFDAFNALVMGGVAIAQARRFDSSDVLAQAVASEINAIGVVSVSAAKAARMVEIRGATGTLLPDAQNVGTEEYPLARRLYLYHFAGANSDAQSFLAFALSPSGQKIAEQTGFVGIEVKRSSQVDDAPKTAEYLALTEGAQRLNVNFHFDESSSQVLDSKAVFDVLRVGKFMRQAENKNARLQVIGITANGGSKFTALVSSENAADLVAQQLARNRVPVNQVRGLVTPEISAELKLATSSDQSHVELWWLPELPIADASN